MNQNPGSQKFRMTNSKQLAEFEQLTWSKLFAPTFLDIFVQ
jgi:hypothetical protein